MGNQQGVPAQPKGSDSEVMDVPMLLALAAAERKRQEEEMKMEQLTMAVGLAAIHQAHQERERQRQIEQQKMEMVAKLALLKGLCDLAAAADSDEEEGASGGARGGLLAIRGGASVPVKKMSGSDFWDLLQFSVSVHPLIRLEEMMSIAVVKEFIQKVDAGAYPITVNNILQFITGASQAPPGGFKKKIRMQFHDRQKCPLPVLSRNDHVISLPRGLPLEKLADVIVKGIKAS